MYLVEIWTILQTSQEGNYYNGRRLTQLLTRITQTTDTIYSETIKSVIQTSYQGCKSTKLQYKTLSTEHRTNLAGSIEESGKGPADNHVLMMKFREDARSLARRIKYIECKIQKSGTSFFTRTLNYGTA